MARRRTLAGTWMLAAAIVASGLLLGSLHTPVLAAVAVLAAAGAALVWLDAEPLAPRPAATVVLAVGVGLVAFTGLQIVPLPRALVAAIAPATADVWARALAPLHEDGPAWITLSLDPAAGRVQLLRGLAYLAVYLGALQIARRREGAAFLERAIVLGVTATAAAALLHPALGARKIFGIYAPRDLVGYLPDHLGPLLNMNHLAGYTNLGLLVAWGSVTDRRGAVPRPIAAVVVLLLGATTVWSLSRGGTAAMLVGVLTATVLAFVARRGRHPGALGRVVAGAGAIAGAAVILLSLFDETRAKFVRGDLSKLDLARDVAALWRPFGALGLGRGAFESVYPSVRTSTEYYVFTHPENVVLQWTTEWGIPVALIAFAALAWALRPATVLARSRPPVGAFAALLALALQNLVDFSSEVPGVMFALAACAALVTGGTGGARPGARARTWATSPRLVAFGPLALVAPVALVAVLRGDGELYADEELLRTAALEPARTAASFDALARPALLRHPAEPYLPYVGAVRASASRDANLLPWAARALERSPVFGRVHLLLARAFYARRPAQARLEYRLACAQDVTLCTVDDRTRLVGDADEALELVPGGERGVPVLASLAEKLGRRLPATVVELDRELLRRDPTNLGPVQRATEASLHDLVEREPWCGGAGASCIEEGLAAAARLVGAQPDRCEGHALASELQVAAGQVDLGLGALDRAIDHVEDRSACARRLVRLAEKTNVAARLDAALERLLKLGCAEADECVDNLVFAAEVETRRGGARRALSLAKRAWERAPDREPLLVDVAERARAEGLHGEALDAYGKLAARHPDDPRWKAAVTREREAVARGLHDLRP